MTPPINPAATPWYRQASKLVTAVASTGAACVSIFTFLYSYGILGKSEAHQTVGNLGVAWVGVRPAVDTATAIGDTLHLAATITDKAGAILVGTSPAWSSENSHVALVRSGYLAHWPDPEELAAHRGAGPDLSAAELLAGRGVLAAGSDTETFEVQPAPERGTPANPQPVHTLLLIERGIYILESLDLEEIARAGLTEFLFVALPLSIRGATGSMLDPVAIT